MDENEIRQELGIGAGEDVGAAIRNLRARNAELAASLETAGATPDAREVIEMRRELNEANRRVLTLENDLTGRIHEIETQRRQERAEATIELMVQQGLVTSANRDVALRYRLNATDEDFEAWRRTLRPVDLTERGAAGATELAALEATAGEMTVAAQFGLTREEMLRGKAKLAGVRLEGAS